MSDELESGEATAELYLGDDDHADTLEDLEPEAAPQPDVPPPNTAMVVADPITPKHQQIGDEFISRIRAVLDGRVPSQICDYAVKRGRSSWDTHDEAITLTLSDKVKVIIKMETKVDSL